MDPDIKLHDMIGREVNTIFSGDRKPGVYEFDFNTSKLSAGVYYVRIIVSLKGEELIQTQKLIKVD